MRDSLRRRMLVRALWVFLLGVGPAISVAVAWCVLTELRGRPPALSAVIPLAVPSEVFGVVMLLLATRVARFLRGTRG